MAADYKKLLIKYIDKVVFVAFLIFFGWQAFKFVTMTTPAEMETIPRAPKESFGTEPALAEAKFALQNFKNPIEPDARHDLTTDPDKIEPNPNEKQCPRCGWIVLRRVVTCPKCHYSWTGVEPPPPDNGNRLPPPVEGIPFRVLSAGLKPVDILFKGIWRKPGGAGTVLQINFADNTRTAMVPEGGLFQDYRLFDLREEEVMYKAPGIPAYPKKVLFVTMQKKGGDPIRVQRNETVKEDVAVATLQAVKGQWRIEHKGKAVGKGQNTFDVYPGDTIIDMADQTITFEVLRITGAAIILKDQDGKEHELPA